VELILNGATLVDGTGADPVENATVRLENGRITQVGGEAPKGSEVMDLAGLTLLPGLIDAHVHLGLSTDLNATLRHDVSAAEIAARMFLNCEQTLDAGFTTVRDAGGVNNGVVGVVESGLVKGPRIIHCGPILCQTGGHGHLGAEWEPSCDWHGHSVPGLSSLSMLTDGVAEMTKNAREAFRAGASFLKLCVTGGVVSKHDRLTDTQFTVEEIRAAVVEAEARGTYVTVHAHNNAGVRNAVEAGVKCIEHGSEIDEETAALMAANNVNLVPTLAVTHTLATNIEEIGLSPEIAERAKGIEKGMERATRIALESGVRVGSGSDLIGPKQDYRGLELVLKSEIVGSMAALVSATKTNAEILNIADRLGTVEEGKIADLIAIDGDPLDKPELFNERERVVLVIKRGEVVKDLRA
jgi:imidazolonepropionase-like amidohydrolase